MYEFLSYIEVDGKPKYLTAKQIFETTQGKQLQEHCGNPDDYVGHGAIRWYYKIGEGVGENRECTDFSIPGNFPPEIVKAIKAGEFKGLVPVPRGLLRKALDDKYSADCKALGDKYWADRKALGDKYWADRKALRDKYWADRKALYAQYDADRKALDDKYWDLFADSQNRATNWS